MKNNKKTGLISLIICGILAIAGAFGGFSRTKVKADGNGAVEYKISREIAKIDSISALKENAFSFYSAVYWCGPYLQWEYSSLDRSVDAGVVNYSQIKASEEVSVTPMGAEVGVNTVFSYTGTHTVGRAESGEEEGATVDRTWAIGFTAPESGTVAISAQTLTMVTSLNADLSMGFSKGARVYIDPSDASLNWKTYEFESGKTYQIEAKEFSVSKGETVFINLYAKAQDGVEDWEERYVSFEYDPIITFEKTPDTTHIFNHMQKLSIDENGALENNVRITLEDDTTYPFSYLYRSTAGADYGFAGQESGLAVSEMAKTTANIDPTGLRLYAPETYSGFIETGVIANVSRSPDPVNVILGFTSPYDGELTISDLAINYGFYPNNKNGYTNINGKPMGSAYKGCAFRVLLNGKQVWPKNGGWDKSLANLYQTATDGYAVGDLIKAQSTYNIEGIKVRKYDEVYFELTRADLTTSEDCDTITINPTFTIDTTADMSDYVYYTTVSDYFDITNANTADSLISYWGVDVKEGLYKRARYNLMGNIDFASLTYTTDIMEDNASDIGWNYFRPQYGEDSALSYTVRESGNLTISAETVFRGGNMALWEMFDLIHRGSGIETDGVRMRIEINGQRAWPLDSAWKEYVPKGANDISGKGVFYFEPVTFGVLPGDVVTIRVNCGERSLYDGFNFNPIFGLHATNDIITNPSITLSDPADEPIKTETPTESVGGGEPTSEKKKGCKNAIGVESVWAITALLAVVRIKRRKTIK